MSSFAKVRFEIFARFSSRNKEQARSLDSEEMRERKKQGRNQRTGGRVLALLTGQSSKRKSEHRFWGMSPSPTAASAQGLV